MSKIKEKKKTTKIDIEEMIYFYGLVIANIVAIFLFAATQEFWVGCVLTGIGAFAALYWVLSDTVEQFKMKQTRTSNLWSITLILGWVLMVIAAFI